MTHSRLGLSTLRLGRVLAVAFLPICAASAAPPTVPVDAPRIFAPGVISTGHDAAPTFTRDGRTVVFGRYVDDRSTILVSHRLKGRWSPPEVAPFSGRWVDQEPVMSPDGKFLIFISSRPATGEGPGIDGFFNGKPFPGKGGNLWRVDRDAHGRWGTPVRLPAVVNGSDSTFGPSIAGDGSVYFMRPADAAPHRFQLFRSQYANGTYQAPVALPFSDGSVTTVDPAVAADERFMVFGAGFKPAADMDLFIAFRDGHGWGRPIHLGTVANAPGSDAEARLAPDQCTLFFASQRPAPDPKLDTGQYNIWRMSLAPWLGKRRCANGGAGRYDG